MKTVLTIAGSDPSGGAGIQVDIQAFQALGVQGVTAITAITAQNEKRFFSLNPLPARLLREQLRAVYPDIPIDAVRIGMLGTDENVLAVNRFLQQSGIKKVVLDPVIKSTTGAVLLTPKGIAILKQLVIPRVMVITPNLSEAEALTKIKVRSLESMKEAALDIYTRYRGVQAVLIKGGHLKQESIDLLYDGRDWKLYPPEQLFPKSVHGTGCALSAALAACLAKGYSLDRSIREAKQYVEEFIQLRQ